jgi:hypothetical protein
MPMRNIFEDAAFDSVEMTHALDLMPFNPQWLGSLNVFEPSPVSTTKIAIEKRDSTLSLIQTTPRGAPLPQLAREARDIRDFRTVRVAKGDRLMASEIQDVVRFGGEELQNAQQETMRRMLRLREDLDLTHEHMRLGAIQGVLLDADGSVIYNWFDEWTISQPAEIDFDLDNGNPASGFVRNTCNAVVRQMKRAAKGAWNEATTVAVGLCGDAFWDQFTGHPEVRETYLNTPEAPNLRLGNAFGTFAFGGITWTNYQGTDDNSTVAIHTDKVKFFPVGGRGVFQHAMAPDETFGGGNQPGKAFYARSVPDRDRDQFVDIEVYSYPLFVCTRPGMLLSGRRT